MTIIRAAAAATAVSFAAAALVAQPPPPAAGRVPARTVTLDRPNATLGEFAATLKAQTGLAVEVAADDAATPCRLAPGAFPFWGAIERAAAATGRRVSVSDQGRRIGFAPGGRAEASAVDGPFRVVAKGVTARSDLEAGRTTYEVALDLHWEPRFPVFRVDAHPAVTRAADDTGANLTTPAGAAKSRVAGYSHPIPVRLDGLTRKATKITTLAGTVTVTASERMLPFTFDALHGPFPAAKTQAGVTATLKRWAFSDAAGMWEAEVELKYPPGQPEFESFESWLTENRIRLVAPDRAKSFAPDEVDDLPGGRPGGVYRFKPPPGAGAPNAPGWALVYDTPAPLVEYPVRFELKDIPLP